MCQLKSVICLSTMLLVSAAASAQQDVINTFAGGGPNNVPATSANVNVPNDVALDSSGNFYILSASQERVFKVDHTTGILTVLAGNGWNGYSGDGGPATQAQLNLCYEYTYEYYDVYGISRVAVDTSGNVYIADTFNAVVRKVDPNTGIISTFAGTPQLRGYGGDGGPATSAYLNWPSGLAVDSSGNVFIADHGNYRIREVTASNGYINTVAGNGTGGYSGDGGPATSAQVSWVDALAVGPTGNVYLSDTTNCAVREFTVGGDINTVAGNGTCGYAGDGGPATSAEVYNPEGLALDSAGNIFIADFYNHMVREVTASNGYISKVAGTGVSGYSGDGGPATSAEFTHVVGVAVDSSDDMFIADDFNYRIREAVLGGNVNTVAGNGTLTYTGNNVPATDAVLDQPWRAATDAAGNVYIADNYNCIVREVNLAGVITTIAGTPAMCGYGGDGGAATSALLYYPTGVAVDSSGDVYIADGSNCVVREVNHSSGDISTFAGTPQSCSFGGDGGPATSAYLYPPGGVAVDSSGNVYIADTSNQRIREVDTSGVINTVAGNGAAGYSGDGGTATSAELYNPFDVALDALGNLYIADTDNHRIRKVNMAGTITTFAGNGAAGYVGDGGPANDSSLDYPHGVAVDAAGDLLIADTINNRIRWVDGAGIIHTVAGDGGYGFSGDGGVATSATLANPLGVGVDSQGNIYIADTGNNFVRKVNAPGGLYASPMELTFELQAVGSTSTAEIVTLTATGSPSISNIATTGDFSESDDCGGGLASGGTCTVWVYFAPTASGTRIGTLTITTNSLFSSTLSVSLQGTGTALTLAPNPLAFGKQNVQTSVTKSVAVKNTGTSGITMGAASLTETTDFSIASNTCAGTLAGGRSCTIGITFDPLTAGAMKGTLVINDSDPTSPQLVELTGTGTGIGAALAPTTLTFAAQDGGTTSAAQTLTLTNELSPTLSITGASFGGANPGDFAVSGGTCPYPTGTLAGTSSCTYTITFTPSINGAESATFSVTDSIGTQSATLKGTGIGATIAPTTLSFGNQDGGTTSAAKTLTLTNYLSSSLSISAALGGANPGDFAVSGGTCPYPTGTLAGTSSCTYTVTFAPSLNGAENATLSVVDADGTQTATLKGTGIGATLAPTTLTFAAQDGGTPSAAKTVTLTNYLTSSLSISAAFGGNNPGDFAVSGGTCPYPSGSLAASSSCTFTVTFTPSLNGAESATLSVSDADGTQTATLKGTGIGAALSPTTLTFAAQDGGTTSAAKTTTLTNYLSSPLSISAALGGANPGDFAVSGGTCPYPTGTLAGTSSCTYTVTFAPSLNGAESATLSVTDADGTQTATLKGTGIGAAIAPTTLTFAAQTKGTTSAAKTLTFTNFLPSGLPISVSFGGTNPGDFAVSGGTCPYASGTVTASSSCTFTVTFTPSVTGAESATLSVSDADGTQTATLKGTGK